MSFENSAGLGVSASYGARKVGGFDAVKKTSGLTYEAVVNFDGDDLPFKLVIPAGAVVTNIKKNFAAGTVSAATVGAVNIASATGTTATRIEVPLGGDLTITGPTAGSIIVEYEFTAASDV
jgi:hypothetical protein